jgi:NAD(P)-dependent dehydrogenase (short-subunit alcohol dehydrogenase family)
MTMEGKVCVITGATGGIGLPTAIALARAGAQVIAVGGRSQARADAAIAKIREAGSPNARAYLADFADLDAVRAVAKQLLVDHERIDVLINNAGLFAGTHRLTKDRLETTIAVNHFAPFLLTNLLLPALRRAAAGGSAKPRVVTVSSTAHKLGRIDWDDLNGKAGLGAYNQSKLANLLFARELARREPWLTSNALHPGAVASDLTGDQKGLFAVAFRLAKPFMKTPEDGARTTIHLATSPEVAGVTGEYFANSRPAWSTGASKDLAAARRLWDTSAEIVGLS